MKLETIQALADRCGVAYEIAHNWAMRGASKGRCDLPLGKQRRPGTSDEAHFQYAHG